MERGWLGSVPVLRVPDAPCHHSSSVELGLAEPGGHCQLSVLSLKSPQWCPEARCCPTAWQMRKRTKSAGEPCAPSKGSVTWATPTPSPTHLQSGFSVKKKKHKNAGEKKEKAVDATSCPQGSQILMVPWEESSALKYSIQVQLVELGKGVFF